MERRQFEQLDGYWVAKETEVTGLHKEHSTKTLINMIEFDTGLTDEVFSQRNLKRMRSLKGIDFANG